MARKNWKQSSHLTVTEALKTHPDRFEFFQVVRLFKKLRTGVAGSRENESDAEYAPVIRFHTTNSLAFPTTSIVGRDDKDIAASRTNVGHQLPFRNEGRRGGDLPTDMTITFYGLNGPSGVLPYHYTQMLSRGGQSSQDFFDLFNHRLVELFYLAWEKSRFFSSTERSGRGGLTKYLLSLSGLGTPGLMTKLDQSTGQFGTENLAFYAGILSQRPRTSKGLQQILAHLFGRTIEVEQLQEHWATIPEPYRCILSSPKSTTQLGMNCFLGSLICDRQSKLRIRIVDLSWKAYREFLPIGQNFRLLCNLVNFYLDSNIEFDLKLCLKTKEIPRFQLGGVHLGWSTWLPNFPANQTAAVVVSAQAETYHENGFGGE